MRTHLATGDWLTPERIKVYSAMMIALAAFGLAGIVVTSTDWLDAFGRPLGTDFSNVWSAGRMALDGAAAIWIVAGAAVYVIGVFLVTILFNVPMNKRLDRMDHAAGTTVDYWRVYGAVWTRWNHVRTIGSLAASICFLAASIALSH